MSGLATVLRTQTRRRCHPGGPEGARRGVSPRALCVAVAAAAGLGVVCGMQAVSPAEAVTSTSEVSLGLSERTVEVSYGDTLWALAKRHGRTGDVYRDMGAICELNELSTSVLQPGQVLRLP